MDVELNSKYGMNSSLVQRELYLKATSACLEEVDIKKINIPLILVRYLIYDCELDSAY